MASASVRLQVQDYSATSSDKSFASFQHAVNWLWQNAHSASLLSSHHRHSRKRRKLNLSQEHAADSPESDDVCLCDLSLSLNPSVYPDESSEGHGQDESNVSTVPVSLTCHKKTTSDKDGLLLSLGSMKARSLINLHCIPAQDANDRHCFSRLPSWIGLWPGSRGSNSDMVYYQCTLRRIVSEHQIHYNLQYKVFWKSDSAPSSAAVFRAADFALSQFLGLQTPKMSHWTPLDFYENVHIPDQSHNPSIHLQSRSLRCDLYPFQKRAVEWMLKRERVAMESDSVVRSHKYTNQTLPISFEAGFDSSGAPIYVSRLLGRVGKAISYADLDFANLRGGILAEEMGLGKTVELISLICLNRQPQPPPPQFEPPACGATLIITPSSILNQWRSEVASHAPSLKVYHYQGLKREGLDREDDTWRMKNILMNQDIVLTSYNELAAEFHYVNHKPSRSLRHEKKYIPHKSPLVEMRWWRVCLDEAQMIESGVSNAAIVCSRIPRCNAWCVSGTPLRKDVKDLQGLLMFLQYEPFCQTNVWNRMIEQDKDTFVEIFGKISMRHTKRAIRKELRIPPQRRVVLTMPFTAVEEQNYMESFHLMCDESGLDTTGGPLSEQWDPESPETIEVMRMWLTRLRQTCLHPRVGARNRRALGDSAIPLRTIDEVLEVMIEQNESSLRTEERSAIMAKATQGHLLSFGGQPHEALRVYLEALDQATRLALDCREVYDRAKQESHEQFKNGERSTGSDASEDEAEEQRDKLGQQRNRLRNALEIEHLCAFFAATSHFQIKTDTTLVEEKSVQYQEIEKEESELYERAKRLRQELLADISDKAKKLMNKVETRPTKDLVEFPRIAYSRNYGGIESRKTIDAAAQMTEMLNAQGDLINEWRGKLVDRLSRRLLDQEETELTGEEYEDSTKQQDEQYALWFTLRAALADRNEIISGLKNTLVAHEVHDALKQARDGRGHAPEMLQSMLHTRERFMMNEQAPMSLRGLIADLRSRITVVRFADQSGFRAAEATMLEHELRKLQDMATSQTRTLSSLGKELDLFRSTMNARLEFYRQLQVISDTVKPLQEEMSNGVDRARLQRETKREEDHRNRLSNLRTKHRFLLHLRESESADKDESKICVICQSPFEVGVLTVCGHMFGKDCIDLWWREHRNCPICKKHLRLSDFHQVTYKPREFHAEEENDDDPLSQEDGKQDALDVSDQSNIYSNISISALNEIKSIDLERSFGTKIDTLARHILWLRQKDPGAKSIIFSQYREFLEFLGTAFKALKIGFATTLDRDSSDRFREDPSKECFLLHARAHSSGLNLTNATHVFLCEPVINTAIELQAIARVHRIGQRRPTTVWMYVVSDTVEESIYELSVNRRLDYIRRRGSSVRSRSTSPSRLKEETLDEANSLELQTAQYSKLFAPGQNNGEFVGKDDLWMCLFGKADQISGAGRRAQNPDVVRLLESDARAGAAERRLQGSRSSG